MWKGGFMNSRKYRVCLIGIIVLALVLGIFIYVNNNKKLETPSDGVLVREMEQDGTKQEAVEA
jgi:hypothetical protein